MLNYINIVKMGNSEMENNVIYKSILESIL